MVATFGETTGEEALKRMFQEMSQHPEGSMILREKPTINTETVDIDALGRLSENTFGYAYYRFLKDNVSFCPLFFSPQYSNWFLFISFLSSFLFYLTLFSRYLSNRTSLQIAAKKFDSLTILSLPT